MVAIQPLLGYSVLIAPMRHRSRFAEIRFSSPFPPQHLPKCLHSSSTAVLRLVLLGRSNCWPFWESGFHCMAKLSIESSIFLNVCSIHCHFHLPINSSMVTGLYAVQVLCSKLYQAHVADKFSRWRRAFKKQWWSLSIC